MDIDFNAIPSEINYAEFIGASDYFTPDCLQVNESILLENIIEEMGELNAFEDLILLSALVRRIAYNLCKTPSAKEIRGWDFDVLLEQYISRLTMKQRVEKIQELANKINLQRFIQSSND